MKKILLVGFVLQSFFGLAQVYFPNNEAISNRNHQVFAFTNATIYVSPTEIVKKGTLLVQDDKIIGVGAVQVPKNANIIDASGKTIYASFIDLYTNFGIDIKKSTKKNGRGGEYDTKQKGFYWNEHIKSSERAIDYYEYDTDKAKSFLKNGFGTILSFIPDGVARGTGMLVNLNMEFPEKQLFENEISNHFSFQKSNYSSQMYPSSLMGTIALLRQFHYDIDWYSRGATTKDMSIEAMIKNKDLVQIFDAPGKQNIVRASKIAKEFNLNYVYKSNGNEFESVEMLKNINPTLIIPIDFPAPYNVSNLYLSNQISLSEMRYWNQAPLNPKILSDNNIKFALTTSNLKNIDDFQTKLLKAIEYGFDKSKALAALTTIPAEILKKSNQIGTLKTGSLANFIITSGDIFDKETIIYENWNQGSKYIVNNSKSIDIRGTYSVSVAQKTNYTMTIKGELTEPSIEILDNENKKLQSKINYTHNTLSILVKPADTLKTNFDRWIATVTNADKISGNISNDVFSTWIATKTKAFEIKKDSTKAEKLPRIMSITFPNNAFGFAEKPKQQTLLFKNATVWTNEKEGILSQTDVLVKNGKIAAVGKNLSDPTAQIVDAKNLHLTSGIIDEHTHIAVSGGINEYGHNSSAEVSVQDIINPEDVNIYRQLAGGVTTAQILHGSANPIGGQSAIIKLKWGETAQELLYKDQPKFIKFALGENPKQTNWAPDSSTRYPKTRMGVEQVYMDYFSRAKAYNESWANYQKNPKSTKPRVDLELQTLGEILDKKRFITCHSYIASEILMLMDVCKKFDFQVNTYTHILEGYKVANEMKANNVGASTFSDWWAYKFEVNDAIPTNASIMHNQGLVVAINSDDAEMARRLNQEAAKSVKYGNLSEEEAWKFVTLNPAKLLHLDDKIGSIKVGKDADLVLWNDNPLSVYAKPLKTLIEGTIYFDIETDAKIKKAQETERNELIMQQLAQKNKGMLTQEPKKKEKKLYHCDSMD